MGKIVKYVDMIFGLVCMAVADTCLNTSDFPKENPI